MALWVNDVEYQGLTQTYMPCSNPRVGCVRSYVIRYLRKKSAIIVLQSDPRTVRRWNCKGCISLQLSSGIVVVVAVVVGGL